MIDTRLRKTVQPGFDLLGKGLARTGLSPNSITVLAFIIGIGAAVALGFGQIFLSLALLWLSGLLDVLDGTVARLTGKSSKIGAYLDLIFDRVVESAMILGFYALMPELAWPLFIFMAGAMFNFTTFLVAASLFKNEGEKSMHYDVGILERTETFILYSLMMLIQPLAIWFVLIFNGLMILTGILRFRRVVTYQSDK